MGAEYIHSDSTDGVLYVIDAATYKVISTIAVGSECLAISISPDGKWIYAANQGDNTISVINTATDQVVSTITTGIAPTGLSVTSDGLWLYVTNQADNNVSQINAATGIITSTFPVGPLPISFGTFITPGKPCNGSPVTFTITVNPSLAKITASAATGYISACAGSASSSPNIGHVTVSGSGLSGGITATAPPGFEVSLNANSGYSASIILSQLAGNINNMIVYVRSAASDPAGSMSGNLVLTSAGAISRNVAITGVVNALPTVNPVLSQTVNNNAPTTAINFTGTTNIFTWTNDTPGIGLAASGTGEIASFTAVNNTANTLTATITATPFIFAAGLHRKYIFK